MAVSVEKDGAVWTVIHSRPDARNAMNPESAAALFDAFLAFDADDDAVVAVFWGEGGAFCAGWDLKYVSVLSGVEALAPYDFPDEGEVREKAEALAQDIARFPQSCVRADRRSACAQHGLSLREPLRQEWWNSKSEVATGIEGAARFADGKGRGGDFSDV
mgnify:CR=1 FL=1